MVPRTHYLRNVCVWFPLVWFCGVIRHFHQYCSYIVAGMSVLMVEETGVPGENHRPSASH